MSMFPSLCKRNFLLAKKTFALFLLLALVVQPIAPSFFYGGFFIPTAHAAEEEIDNDNSDNADDAEADSSFAEDSEEQEDTQSEESEEITPTSEEETTQASETTPPVDTAEEVDTTSPEEANTENSTPEENTEAAAPEESTTSSETKKETWTVDGDKATTTESVKLGVKYEAPQNKEVTVTFTKLPENPGTLSIEEITLTKEQVEALGVTSDKAYDITSSMENGSFEYELTLPIPEGMKNAQIVYAEKAEDLTEAKVVEKKDLEVEKDTVTATLDHFTVFVATYSNVALTVLDTLFSQGDTVYAKATISGADWLFWHRLDIVEPNGTKHKIAGCSIYTTSLSGSYVLPANAELSADWKVMASRGYLSQTACNNDFLPIDPLATAQNFTVEAKVTTVDATDITPADATLNGKNGSTATNGHSFWVSLAPFSTASPSIPAGVSSTQVLGGLSPNEDFSVPLSLLTTSAYAGNNLPAITPNTTYYFAAWVEIGGTWYPGEVKSFTTGSVTTNTTTTTITGNTAAGENQPGWMFNRDASTTTPFLFDTDEHSIGSGAAHILPIGSNPSDKFIAEYFAQALMGDVDSFSYDFNIGAGGAAADANKFYLNIYANFATSSPTKFYDCRYNIIPTSGVVNGWTTVTFDPTQSYSAVKHVSSPANCPAKPADMGPNAVIRAFAINVGDTTISDTGLDGYLDNVILTTTDNTFTQEVRIFDFEAPVVDTEAPEVPTAVYNEDTSGNAVANGGYTDEEYFVFSLTAAGDPTRYQLKYWNDIVGSPFKVGSPWNPSDLSGYSPSFGLYRDHFTQGEGTHYFAFSACDAANNCSAYSAPFVVTYDHTAPSTPVNGTPHNVTIPTNNFDFEWDDATDNSPLTYEFQSSLNPAQSGGVLTTSLWQSGILPTSMIHSSGAQDGTWYWQVRAVDAAGNTSAWSEIWNVTLDTTSPAVPTLLFPENGIPVNGTAPIANDWEDVADAHHYVYQSYNVDGAGNCNLASIRFTSTYTDSQTNSRTFADGLKFCWRVKAVDAIGNESGWSDLWKTIADNTSPTVDLVFPTPGVGATSFQAVFSENVKEAEAENGANYFLSNWPGAGGSGDLAGDVMITYDSGTKTATIQMTNPDWYVSPEQTWGVQNIHDLAGNVQVVNPYSETSTPLVAPVTTDSGTDTNWHNAPVTVTLTCDDGPATTGSGCKTTYYTTDGADPTTASTQGTSVVVATEGETTVKYFSVDNAGNVEAVKTAANLVKVDLTLPTVGYSIAPANPDGDNDWYTSAPTVTLTADDALSGVDRIEYSLDGGSSWNLYSTPFAVNDGVWTIQYRSFDVAGNESVNGTAHVKVDTQDPDEVNDLDAEYRDDEDDIHLTWNVDDNDIDRVFIYRGSSSSFNTNSGNKIGENDDNDDTFNDDDVEIGETYYYKLVSIDEAGNRSGANTIKVEIEDDGTGGGTAVVTDLGTQPADEGEVLGVETTEAGGDSSEQGATNQEGGEVLGAQAENGGVNGLMDFLKKYSWWWLIILLIIGYTGYKYYSNKQNPSA